MTQVVVREHLMGGPPVAFGAVAGFAALYLDIKGGRGQPEQRLRWLQAYGDSQLRLVGRALSILRRVTEGRTEPLVLTCLLQHVQSDMQAQARLPEVRFYVQLVLAELLLQLDRAEPALRAVSAALADLDVPDPELRERVLDLHRVALGRVQGQAVEVSPAGLPERWVQERHRLTLRLELLTGKRGVPWTAGLTPGGTVSQMVDEDMLGTLATLTALPLSRLSEARVRGWLREALGLPETQFSDVALSHWRRVLVHLLLGELGLALRLVGGQVERGAAVFEVLIRAAHLETLIRAVQWATPHLASAQRDFLAVFYEVVRAGWSAQELAQLVWRWHPVAATYLACVPDGPEAFGFARSSLLKAGVRNAAYDLTLPPAYAAETILRSFGLGCERYPLSQAPLSSRMRLQRGRLETPYGALRLWRPVVSGMLIACAFMRHGSAVYEGAARQLLREFGTVPQRRGEYMGHELERLEGLVRNVVAGESAGGIVPIDRIL